MQNGNYSKKWQIFTWSSILSGWLNILPAIIFFLFILSSFPTFNDYPDFDEPSKKRTHWEKIKLSMSVDYAKERLEREIQKETKFFRKKYDSKINEISKHLNYEPSDNNHNKYRGVNKFDANEAFDPKLDLAEYKYKSFKEGKKELELVNQIAELDKEYEALLLKKKELLNE